MRSKGAVTSGGDVVGSAMGTVLADFVYFSVFLQSDHRRCLFGAVLKADVY